MALWRRITSRAARSPRRCVISVNPSMSLNISVTVPSGAACVAMSGRRASIDAATTSMVCFSSWVDELPWTRSLSASTRSSQGVPAPIWR
jgi:hypothetical protein